jgi:DNA-binding response OmpR family regulator
MEKRILVVDDDPVFVRLVKGVLSQKGYEVLTAGDGQEAMQVLFAHKPDLVLLDIQMPRMDGWQTCSRIREVCDTPIVMLTGMQTTEADVVRGLDYGADDYLIKPVGNRELVARVRAIMRRAETPAGSTDEKQITYNDDYLSVDIASRNVMVQGKRVKLTPIEFRLFAILVENASRIMTHKQLLERVWGWEYIDDLDYVRIYISHLRQKIEKDPAKPEYIMTEAGVGYYFKKAT